MNYIIVWAGENTQQHKKQTKEKNTQSLRSGLCHHIRGIFITNHFAITDTLTNTNNTYCKIQQRKKYP